MVLVRLRELKCPFCRNKNLKRTSGDKEKSYTCTFCGAKITIVEEEKNLIVVDVSETHIKYHHVTSRMGDSTFITCPHCGRIIYLWFKTLELDSDWINIVVLKGEEKVLDKVKIPPEEDVEK